NLGGDGGHHRPAFPGAAMAAAFRIFVDEMISKPDDLEPDIPRGPGHLDKVAVARRIAEMRALSHRNHQPETHRAFGVVPDGMGDDGLGVFGVHVVSWRLARSLVDVAGGY